MLRGVVEIFKFKLKKKTSNLNFQRPFIARMCHCNVNIIFCPMVFKKAKRDAKTFPFFVIDVSKIVLDL